MGSMRWHLSAMRLNDLNLKLRHKKLHQAADSKLSQNNLRQL